MLSVRNREGLEEPLTDVKVSLNRKVNGEKTLTYEITPTLQNAEGFKLVKEESILTFNGEEYVIKKMSQRSIGNRYKKQGTAIHKFFTDMIDLRQRSIHNGSLTFGNAMKFIFDGTPYTYVVSDQFNAETFENFGGDNRLALLQTILERYKAEMEINDNQVLFKKQVGNDTDFQFRYGHNIKTFSRDFDTSNLSTYIKGYGKLKDKKDVLSGEKIPYDTRTGTFFFDGKLDQFATKTVGSGFKFSFTGTGFRFKTLVTRECGVWEFNIDGAQTIDISTYKDVTFEERTIEVVRELEHKKHNVTVKFKGADSKNPLTKGSLSIPPIAYLLEGDIIELYRELVGDEAYQAVAEYTSPNVDVYGFRDAGDVVDERFTSNDSLLKEIKSRLQDTPEVSLSIDFVDLRAAGYPYTVPNEGDRVFTIYEPIEGLSDGVEIENRILEIDEEFKPIDEFPYFVAVRTRVTLANFKKTFAGSLIGNVQKTLKQIMDEDGKLKLTAYNDAVIQATKVLTSVQTELEFVNGIIARDKVDPNKLLLLNSAGIGLSKDGGNSFGYAITGDGIVAEYIVAGMMRGMIFASESDDSTMWIQGGDIRLEDPARNRSLNLNPLGLYGFNDAGEVIFQVNKTWVTSSILGTNTKNVYLAAGETVDDISGEARIVHIKNIPSDGEVDSYTYLPLRAAGFKGNYIDVNSGTAGINLYLRPLKDGEVRVTAAGTTDIYYPLRAASIFGTAFVTTTTNAYIGSDNELRVVSKGAATEADIAPIYRNVRANGYFGQFLTADPDFYAYIGTDLGLRVTSRGLASAGPIYRDVIAAGFTNGSRIESKTDIELWDGDALEIIKNSDITTYYLKGDLEQGRTLRKYGLVIGGDWRTPEHVINGDGVDQYAMETTSWLAIQQLIKRLEAAEEKILKLESA